MKIGNKMLNLVWRPHRESLELFQLTATTCASFVNLRRETSLGGLQNRIFLLHRSLIELSQNTLQKFHLQQS